MTNFESQEYLTPYSSQSICKIESLASIQTSQSPIDAFLKQVFFEPKPTKTSSVDISNCGQLALFPTSNGQQYLVFQTIHLQQTFAYFNPILQSSLNNQSSFMPEQLQSPYERDRMVMSIIKFHQQFSFKAETLHLTVAIADKFLSVRNLKQFQYEIVGVTSLWMAAKIEETTIPPFGEWLIVGNGCLAEELVEFECEILKVLDYNLNIPTALSFFNLLLTQTQIQQRALFLCHYLLEMALVDSKYLNYQYNVVFTSAYYLAMMVCDKQSWQEEYYCKLTNVNPYQVEECAGQLLQSMINADTMKDQNQVCIKFSGQCFFNVSQIVFIEQKERSVSAKSTMSAYSKCSN